MSGRRLVEVDGTRLAVSNLDKVLYPAGGFTKAQVIDHYVTVAPHLLRHLVGRPVTLRRFPDGVEGEAFWEKRCPEHRPDFVRTVRLGRSGRDKVVDHCDVADLPSLVWVANLAALELHASLSRRPDTGVPTCVVFDLDPGDGAGMVECARVALRLREVFDRLDLLAVPKTSGGKGLQLYVPVNSPTSYTATSAFAKGVGELLARVHPDLVVTVMGTQRRAGRVLVDWSQNSLTKTTVCVYSLRAEPVPTVSTPVTWDEVAAAADSTAPLRFHAHDLPGRLQTHGDLFAPVDDVAQELPDLA